MSRKVTGHGGTARKAVRNGSRSARSAAAPRATYRLQLHSQFTFAQATAIVPYLAALGISHVYCSPYFRARAGSTHGYDIVGHNRFNPEIGSREDFERFVAALRAHDMGHIVDFVPNHVGIMGAENARWMDVLEKGEESQYASFFDIDWHPADPDLDGKVLVPVLGDYYGAVLERGELQLRHEPETNTYAVYYHEHRFPINPRDHERARELLSTTAQPNADDLHELLERQAYRLAYWRLASDEVNYRRFFDVNDLAALRMENEAVFEETHRLVLELLKEGKVDGLRIDHPDGLYDPAQYFERLQSRCAEIGRFPLYLLAEKITARYERLPSDWVISGETGYDFANLVNGLFVDRAGRGRLDRTYRAFTGEERSWEDVVFESKQLILRTSLAAEVTVLANQLHRIARADRRTRDYSLNACRQALRDLIACFPVYRTYIADGISSEDERFIAWAVQRARKRSQAADVTIFDFLADILLHRTPQAGEQTGDLASQIRTFAMKFQQVTSPAAAKGVEDTAFYRFSRLLSLNEVGGDPDSFGISVTNFHRENRRRLKDWPNAMLASSTHDTKRSEDVRARIDVLSEMPGAWRAALKRWNRMNRSRRVALDDQPAPSLEDEYLLYQTLLGSWPLHSADDAAQTEYIERIEQYTVKAAREAKQRSSWANVNETYEQALKNFVRAILTPAVDPTQSTAGNVFLTDLISTQTRIVQLGLLNSLSQTALKLTAPGVPDIYQGNELWDFSLVDPDNRRPVDFERRRQMLQALQSWEHLPPEELQQQLAGLWTNPADGRAKLYLTWRALTLRRALPEIFSRGRYVPLHTQGQHGARLCAFARTSGDATVVVVAPRLLARLLPQQPPFTPQSIAWGETNLLLDPSLRCERLIDVLSGRQTEVDSSGSEQTLRVGRLLERFPVALLRST